MKDNPFINSKQLKIPWRTNKSFPNCRIIAIPENHVAFFEEIFERVGSSISWECTEDEHQSLNLMGLSDEDFMKVCSITTK